jgi:murein DD-endopeptidase MepM/ murein hydrolase activator NlpD
MSKFELWYPIKSQITQRFGENLSPYYAQIGLAGHNGIDYTAYDGQPVRAAHDGVVTFSGYDGSGGLGIVIRTTEKHPFEDGESYFKSIYWHLKSGTIKVKATDFVKAGDIIAGADNTGVSTGTHLHFGIKPTLPAGSENDWEWVNPKQNNGYMGAIDPAPYFNGFYAEDAQKVLGWLNQAIELLTSFIKK